MIFIYSNWVSTWWQWSVDLYKDRKETAQKEKQKTKQYKNDTKTQNTSHKLFEVGRNIEQYQT